MIDEQTAISMLLSCHPNVTTVRDKYLCQLCINELSIGQELASFSNYFINRAATLSDNEIQTVFVVIEKLMEFGTDAVRTAVATEFLESLQNYASSGKLDFASLSASLGPLSRAFCKEMDKFWSSKTPGM